MIKVNHTWCKLRSRDIYQICHVLIKLDAPKQETIIRCACFFHDLKRWWAMPPCVVQDMADPRGVWAGAHSPEASLSNRISHLGNHTRSSLIFFNWELSSLHAFDIHAILEMGIDHIPTSLSTIQKAYSSLLQHGPNQKVATLRNVTFKSRRLHPLSWLMFHSFI